MNANGIPEVACPAIIGRKEAARLLGIKPENLFRLEGVPRPLQERRIKGFEVTTGPLWPRAEMEAFVKLEKARKRDRDKAAAKRAAERSRQKMKARKGKPSKRARAGASR